MEYGLIGKKLGHSFSKQIHESIGKYKYDLIEIDEKELDTFMLEKNFKAINVTIPYKEKVIPYLDYVSDEALKINAVNTIINKDGKLYGYNTDYYGLKVMLEYFDISVNGKNIMILGTGGTSKTATSLLNDLKANKITYVSRSEKENVISYESINNYASDIDILINTTPVEMFPNNNKEIIETIDSFTSLKSIVDVIYNPLTTNLVLKGKAKGLNCCNGLYMLIAQAFYAVELFKDIKLDKKIIEDLYLKMLNEKQNIVLIGMPGSGKSTVGKIISRKLKRKFVDIDKAIEKKINMSIKEFFKVNGEEAFRNIESEVILEVSKETNLVIATGGGSILRKENVNNLKLNGKLYFLNRSVDKLAMGSKRPLSSNKKDLYKRYNERKDIYHSVCDVKINANRSIFKVVYAIIGGKV